MKNYFVLGLSLVIGLMISNILQASYGEEYEPGKEIRPGVFSTKIAGIKLTSPEDGSYNLLKALDEFYGRYVDFHSIETTGYGIR
jgi:hypothetical protein